MTSRWRSSFGGAACVLGLALATQLASAGQLCLAVSTVTRSVEASRTLEPGAVLKTVAPHAAARACCGAAGAQPAPVCIADSHRVDLSIAAASLSADHPALAAATECFLRTAGATAQSRLSPGLTPGFRSPAHILFGRYLS